MDNISAVTIEDAAQVIKRSANIQIRYINMPMLMRFLRPDKPIALAGEDGIPSFQQPGQAENPVDTAGTDSDHIGIQHHEGQASVALGWMKPIIINDHLFLPVLQPIITGDPMVVFVDFPVTTPPVIKLTGADLQPADKNTCGNISLSAPETDKINYLVARVVGNPSGI